jgi:hypothetical protein
MRVADGAPWHLHHDAVATLDDPSDFRRFHPEVSLIAIDG